MNNKPTKQVFDVSRPGRVPANPSSKPIIVSNKPQQEDPMMAPAPQMINGAMDDDFKPVGSSGSKPIEEKAEQDVSSSEAIQIKEDQPPPPKPKKSGPNLVVVIVTLVIIILLVLDALYYKGVISIPK